MPIKTSYHQLELQHRVSRFMVGTQPCRNFKPREQDFDACYGFGYHSEECPICKIEVIFCDTCNKTHHSGGWQQCLNKAYAQDDGVIYE